jgi:hypothetical protein
MVWPQYLGSFPFRSTNNAPGTYAVDAPAMRWSILVIDELRTLLVSSLLWSWLDNSFTAPPLDPSPTVFYAKPYHAHDENDDNEQDKHAEI